MSTRDEVCVCGGIIWSMKKTSAALLYQLLPDEDLTEAQMYATTQTLDAHARTYAAAWEWNPVTIREIKKYNIVPFLPHVTPGGTILIAENQSGRDYEIFTKEGFRCLGISRSFGLLQEALARVPHGLFLHLDIRSLPFMPESFDAIYADAMVHVPKKDVRTMLKDFRIFLRPSGVIYVSVLLGDGNVIVTDDSGGKRYMTVYTKEDVDSALANAGFSHLWSATSSHTDPAMPNWYSVVAKKQ